MTVTARKLFGATNQIDTAPAATAACDQADWYAAQMARSHAARRMPKGMVVPFPAPAPRRSMALAA